MKAIIELDECPKCCFICRFYYMYDKNEISYKESKRDGDINYSFRCMADLKLRRTTTEEMTKTRPADCPIKIKENKE